MIERFHIIEEAAVILRSKGVFRQAKVYRRGSVLFAGHAGGYIGLKGGGGTTIPSVSWEAIEVPGGHDEPRFGNLTSKAHE